MNRVGFIPVVLAGVLACADGTTAPKLTEDAAPLPAMPNRLFYIAKLPG